MSARPLSLLVLFGCATVPTPQRTQQAISRTMARCLATPMAQRYGWAALECDCVAKRACVAAGLPRGCGYDDLALETEGGYPVVVGRCRD